MPPAPGCGLTRTYVSTSLGEHQRQNLQPQPPRLHQHAKRHTLILLSLDLYAPAGNGTCLETASTAQTLKRNLASPQRNSMPGIQGLGARARACRKGIMSVFRGDLALQRMPARTRAAVAECCCWGWMSTLEIEYEYPSNAFPGK